ncbi:BTB domain-containing protein [Caenorhabditis elegans]|uniref:BTB domain-containing protein n=1 Tax=Caenorhabditis elegans TaxID=6239 RepID=O16711_CAEEL|nr:BTB domain-containing protein [Caenorhabditis elegans]CCD68452.1 BTB domain-containing protein [Caenorhabditis elegans]|eukprot:NP_494320.2 Uncharacterized protein CELE_F22E5.6 [Caenorhabditis elegans]
MSFTDEKIRLNIGGTIFETSKSTLTKFDGFFKTLLETDIPIQKDDSNCIFIDRSPRHFEKILNYLRDGADVDLLPESEKEVREILKEAQFYLLEGLMELCKRSSCKIRTFESYHHLLKLIAEAGKPVLVMFYLVKDNRIVHVPNNFEFLDFLEKHQGKLDIYFKESPYETTHQNPSQFLPPGREEAAPSWTYCFYNTPKLPFRFTISFVEKLEEDIEFVLGNLNK